MRRIRIWVTLLTLVLAVIACARLGLSGNALNLCEAGQNPGAFSWSSDYDCETT